MEWVEHAAEFAQNYEALISLLAFIGGAVITGGLGWRWFRWLMEERDRLQDEVARINQERKEIEKNFEETLNAHKRLQLIIERAKGFFRSEERSLWLREPINFPHNYTNSITRVKPIVVIANLKGGVGKTTISANLPAYFEDIHQERVLAIDLDYQGSLSSMLMPGEAYRDFARSRASGEGLEKILAGEAAAEALFEWTYPVQDTKNDSRILPCRPEFADKEQQVMVKWLLDDANDAKDIRFNLACILFSEPVQRNFDRIIIDTPPRVTTGFINALCSATYLLIPFQLDILAAERVGLFLKDVGRLKPKLLPGLGAIDIVATMKSTATGHLQIAEQEALRRVTSDAHNAWGLGFGARLIEPMIPRRASIAQNAGLRPTYPENQDIFNPIGETVFRHSTKEFAI